MYLFVVSMSVLFLTRVSRKVSLLRGRDDVRGGAAAGGRQWRERHALRHYEAHYRREVSNHCGSLPGELRVQAVFSLVYRMLRH